MLQDINNNNNNLHALKNDIFLSEAAKNSLVAKADTVYYYVTTEESFIMTVRLSKTN